MALMTYAEAAVLAMAHEMEADPRVVVIGEDVGRGDSVYESVFAYDKYLRCLWTDAATICEARTAGAVAQLTRIAFCGIQAGDYDYAETISGDLYDQLSADPSVAVRTFDNLRTILDAARESAKTGQRIQLQTRP